MTMLYTLFRYLFVLNITYITNSIKLYSYHTHLLEFDKVGKDYIILNKNFQL